MRNLLLKLPWKNGAQRRIRTTDTRIFSPLLYQLSYLGLAGKRNVADRISGKRRGHPLKARGL
jgi:hypothetical protein